MTAFTTYTCDKCDKKIEENLGWDLNATRLYCFGELIEGHSFHLCTDCYKTLVEKLKIKGKHHQIL